MCCVDWPKGMDLVTFVDSNVAVRLWISIILERKLTNKKQRNIFALAGYLALWLIVVKRAWKKNRWLYYWLGLISGQILVTSFPFTFDKKLRDLMITGKTSITSGSYSTACSVRGQQTKNAQNPWKSRKK